MKKKQDGHKLNRKTVDTITNVMLLYGLFYIYLCEHSIVCLSLDTYNESTCPGECVCREYPGGTGRMKVDCTSRNFTFLPELDRDTVTLDLTLNHISTLPDRAFSSLKRLKYLFFESNGLSSLPANVFVGLNRLEGLHLQGNKFKVLPRKALRNLHSLILLYIDHNEISRVHDNSFRTLHNLKNIRLDANRLTEVPVVALNQARGLESIDLDNNLIENIPDYAFCNLTELSILKLSHNKIAHIGEKAFEGLRVLSILELKYNNLKVVPEAINSLPDLTDLALVENRIAYLPDVSFIGNRKLFSIRLKDNPITSIGNNTFNNLPFLVEIKLSEVRKMTHFPHLIGTHNLKKIILDRASINSLPENLCTNNRKLEVLDVHTNKISMIPNLSSCVNLTLLNLGNNDISSFDHNPLKGLGELKDLTLSYNYIESIPEGAFVGLKKLNYLDLSHNRITFIHDNAFVSLEKIIDLNLGENKFPVLPTKGLRHLEHLKTFHNKELVEPPSSDALPNILTMALAYAYHCCAFIRRAKETESASNTNSFEFKQTLTWLGKNNTDTGVDPWSDTIFDDLNYTALYFDQNYLSLYDNVYDNETLDYVEPSIYDVHHMVKIKPPVECRPMPGPFLPCDDLFGWWSLRCGVWLVFLLAVLGNGAVLFVSITSRSKMDVTRFLICNLAMSDLCMGVYLGFLAVVDASTLGEFEKYAVRWQSSPGCLVAGFLGVLSSELSVFTLVVITVERFYAISHAMQLDKRVSLKHAAIVMSFGWLVCAVIASLPLFEISDYRKFAICLPFDTENKVSLGYVCFIMLFNAVSFFIIVLCYTGMFISIRGSHSWNSKDSVVAKRMALLVFTDFFCWSPIIFFSLTAAFETNFANISLDEAKVLTIFVLPLNSCANPFLYAFFTRQFKRDCVKICKRIEESSMSRHFPSSGVRRASNSSNRQSQSNTCNIKPNCDHSMIESNNFGEASNNNSEDSDLHVKSFPLTEEEEQILQYVRSDSGICVDTHKIVPLRGDISPDICVKSDLQLVPLLSASSQKRAMKKSHIEEENTVSNADIVLHTKEGHVVVNTKKKDKVKKEHQRDKSTRVKSTKRPCRYIEAQTSTVQNNELDSFDEIIELPSPNKDSLDMFGVKNNTKHTRQKLLKAKFEADRSADIGLKIDRYKPLRNYKKPHSADVEHKPCRNISTQTIMNVQMRRPNTEGLPADIERRDRYKHINEWRKTSHLSFLWRNAGSFEAVAQKQKSNSLVELTRPIQDWKGLPGKRHSLTSRHEGYILLKNGSRDSAYEEEEMYEFREGKVVYVPHAKLKNSNTPTNVCLVIPKQSKTRKGMTSSISRDYSVDSDEITETSILLPIPDNSSCVQTKSRHKHSYDDESGISSNS